MARTRRYYAHSNSFAAGLLSEAAIDAVDSELAQMGLGVARNVVVLRDGGLKTRPPFQLRSLDSPIPVPTHQAIGDRPLERDVRDQTRFVLVGDGSPWSGVPRADGSLEFRRHLILRASSADAGFFRVRVRPGTRPRALTLYGCRLLVGSWKTTVNDAELLTFEVWRKPVGTSAVKNHVTEHDPFAPGTFAPGVVRRDIVIPLDHTVAGPQDLEWVELRVPHSETALGLNLAIEAISAYVSDVGTAPAELEEGVFIPGSGQGVSDYELASLTGRSIVRMLPWQIRATRLAFVLAPDYAAYYFIPDQGPAVRQGESPNAWHFTARQLRELTYTGYQTGLLLCHRDFPHPLLCSLPRPGEETIRIEPLALENVPDLSPELVEDAGIEIDETGSVIITTPAGVAGAVTGLTVTNEDLGLLVRWPSTGADAYDVMWDLASAYDADPVAWQAARGRNIASDVLPESKTTALPATQYEIEGLIGDEHYVVAVRSIAAGGFSEIVEVQRGQPFRGPPTAVRNFEAAASETISGRIGLSWSTEPLAVSYQLEWRDEDLTTSIGNREAGWQRESIPQPAAASVTYQFLGTVERRYGFRIRMEDRGGRTLETWAEAQAVAPAVPLPQVMGLTATIVPNEDGSQNAGEIVLAWTALANPDPQQTYEYRSRLATSTDDDDWEHTDAREEVRAVFTGEVGDKYAFQVRAARVARRWLPGPWSAEVQETAPASAEPTPDAPTRIPVIYNIETPSQYRRIAIGWVIPGQATDPEVISSYEVWYREKKTGTPNVWSKSSAPGDQPAFTLVNIGTGEVRTYEFQVRARNAGGDGPWSGIAEGMTLEEPLFPPTFVVTYQAPRERVPFGSIGVHWTTPTGYDGTELRVNGRDRSHTANYFGFIIRRNQLNSRRTFEVRSVLGNRKSRWVSRTIVIAEYVADQILAREGGAGGEGALGIRGLTRMQLVNALTGLLAGLRAETPGALGRLGAFGDRAGAVGYTTRELLDAMAEAAGRLGFGPAVDPAYGGQAFVDDDDPVD